MKELIEEALRVSCLLWNADIEKVRNNTSRLKNNVRAKRMFVYYIYSFLEVSYVDIKNYIIGFNHASSIYHVKEFNKDLDNDPDVKKILWGGQFWTSGYYANTVGQYGNAKVIGEYVKNQGKKYEKIHSGQITMFEGV